MQRGLSHLRDVTRAMLDQNRLDRTGQPLRPEDFEDLRLLFEPEAASRGQVLDWEVGAGVACLALLPAAPVRQIVLNLLLNAGSAAGREGRVGLGLANGARQLSITISDDGPGFAPGDLGRLLASGPLPPGGGVGLRLVHDLVESLGGTIEHDRREGTTYVRVDLPLDGGAHA
jgi:signal transduction histidine kinase